MSERMHTLSLEITHRSYGIGDDGVVQDDAQTHGTTLLIGVSIDPEGGIESAHRSVAIALERFFKMNAQAGAILQLG